MEDLLDKFDLESDKKFFLIFDVDGTLRPDTVDCLDHRYPKIDPKAAKQLRDLNTHDRVDIIVLTARSYVDIFRSNLPKNIIKYCGFGKQIVENDVLKYSREEFTRAYDETVFFIDIVKDILGPDLSKELDFLVTPGDFAIYFESEHYEQKKASIMSILKIVFAHSKRWHVLDLGKEVVFKDSKYYYDKGNAVWDILDKMNLNDPTKVFFFGDSAADHRAMVALREYQKANSQKRLKVKNICVGQAINDDNSVDMRFESYKETLKFVDLLHHKIFG